MNTKLLAETIFIKELITKKYPTGVVSLVMDSYDYWSILTQALPALKEDILSRKPNNLGLAKTVCRPDSGDPVKIICGLRSVNESEIPTWDSEFLEDFDVIQTSDGKYYTFYESSEWEYGEEIYRGYTLENEVPEYEVKGSVEVLWDIFGGTVSDKGYKTLNQRVGLIYGDSITLERAELILQRLKDKGFASDNVVFGIGSYTYQFNTRDSYGFAMKATHAVVNGVARDIYKDPKTGDGLKKSAKGLLRVEKEGDDFVLYDQQTPEQEKQGELKVVFEDGKVYNTQSLEQIRNNLWK